MGRVVRLDCECEGCGENIGCECDASKRLGPCDACEEHDCPSVCPDDQPVEVDYATAIDRAMNDEL